MKQLTCFALTISMLRSVLATSVMIHSIGSLRDTVSVGCGSNITFICSIPTYKYTMKWIIDSDKVAECVTTNCVQYPPYEVDNIAFSPDTSNREFNMTINPVTLKADGRIIKCRYGSKGVQLKLVVKVLPIRNTTELVESKDENRNMIKITAITGCVFPSSAVSVQWYCYEEDHASKLYKMTSSIVATKFSVCPSGICGENGGVKISSTLYIQDVQNVKAYFVQIAIRNADNGDTILVNSKRSYQINEVSTIVNIHSVGSLRETGSLQCGSKVTFICSIPTYTYNMVWLIDSDKVAECTTTNCVQYPPFKVDNIEFSPNTTSGEFNMTINPVTLKADGRMIKCSYGSEGVQLKLAVKVFPTQNTTEIVESKDDSQNMINITATTGCVYPSSAVTMQWYYYEEGHTPKLHKMSSPTVTIISSVCTSGRNGVVRISSTLSILDGQNGKEYFFQIAIGHEDTGDIILVNSTRSYKLNEIPFEICKESVLPVAGIVVSLVVVILVVLVVMVVRHLLYSRKQSENQQYIKGTKQATVNNFYMILIEQRKRKQGRML